MREQGERSPAQGYFWPTVWAVGLHALLFGLLFASFAFTPDLPPAKPVVQVTLYELKSKSPATVQTNQKIAGEAKKTAARQYEVEQLAAKKIEQQKQAAAAEAQQQKAEDAQKAEQMKAATEAKQAEQKAEQTQKAEAAKEVAKKAEEKKLADIAKKKTEAEQKKAAEDAKKKEQAKKAADAKQEQAKKDTAKKAEALAAKNKAAADAKKKAAEDAKKQAADAAAKQEKAVEAARKATEDKKAQALAELLSDSTDRQAALADEIGDQVSGNFDDLIRLRAAEGWSRPPGANNSMTVTVRVNMLPDGTITGVTVARSSGNGPFDSSAVAAVKNIGRIAEMQGLSPQDFNPYRSFNMTFTPEDLAL